MEGPRPMRPPGSAIYGDGFRGPEARLKRGDSDDVIIVESFALFFVKSLLITLEPHLISFEASHMFVKIKKFLCKCAKRAPPTTFNV